MSKITYFSPSHEQLPSFHVSEDLLPSFLAALKTNGLEVWEEPTHLETAAQGDSEILCEVKIKAGTPEDELQKLAEDFKQQHSI